MKMQLIEKAGNAQRDCQLSFFLVAVFWYSKEYSGTYKEDFVKKWRRETQFLHVAGSLLCGDIILQHLMTSFWMTCTFWILNKQVKKFISEAVHNFSQI